jgi:HD-GYP domain-containing protein (c-di-GMP phosphodiesterase class II)
MPRHEAIMGVPRVLPPAFRLDQLHEFPFGDGERHEDRVGRLTYALALALDLDPVEAERLGAAAVLHDIGKGAIPAAILGKPAALDTDERQIVQTHSRLGHDVLSGNSGGFLATAAAIALSHHEAFDGSGYRQGLRGEAIPFAARIVALADVYAALRELRPYRPPLSHDAAAAIILDGDDRSGPGTFDPAVLDAFRRSAQVFDLISS